MKSMVGLEGPGAHGVLGLSRILTAVAVTIIVLAYHVLMRDSSLEQLAKKSPWWAQASVIAGSLLVLLWNSSQGGGRAFIYFQF